MTREEAFKIIDQLIGSYKGTRDEHLLLQQAFNLLKFLVEGSQANEEKVKVGAVHPKLAKKPDLN